MSLSKRNFVLAIAGCLVISGCVSADFREPVGGFTTAMTAANASVRTYFTDMNDFERRIYLKRVLYNDDLNVAAASADRLPTGLTPVFSSASVKARLDSLSLLTVYGERLAALAGADSPARFQAGSAVLGENLGKLSTTFQKLAGAAEPDPTAAKYVGPISTIVGVFGEMILEAKREAALKRAVNEGAPAVDAVLTQLDADLKTVVDPLVETGLLQQLSDAANYYNLNRSKLTFEQRQAILSEIDDIAQRYQAALTADPSEAIDGIRDAHAALVKYANSSRKPQDLNALVAAIDTFNNRLKPIVDAISKLRS